MGFLERVAARVFEAVFDKVWALVQARVQEKVDIEKISRHHDKVSSELTDQLIAASSKEEVDAALDKIYNYSNPS